MSKKFKSLIEIFIIIILFIFFSYIAQTNIDLIKEYMNNDFGVLLYIIITIIAIVVAPISTLPLLPIASNLYGWKTAAVLSIIGWLIGALIAFEIARKYGVPLIKKFIPLEKINKIEKLIPSENIFFSVIFLRMVVPVDILSYVLGLFSKLSRKKYFLATIIGITPFAFVFSYLGKMPFYYQIIAFAIGSLILLIGWIISSQKKSWNDLKLFAKKLL